MMKKTVVFITSLNNTIDNALFADLQPEDSGTYQCYLASDAQNAVSLEIFVKGYNFILT